MRSRTLILASTSLAALLGAVPATAQDSAAPPAASDAAVPATSQAPQRPAEQATNANQAENVTGAPGDQTAGQAQIVVTGLRRSLQSAETIKRTSPQIVDSIVAEDIGKLPDVTVSDTAARIPGVEVERGGGEASRVLIRGLPDFTTTYNGRDIFTAETRVVALQDFPAGGIAALEVYKTTTADLIEGGLAGEVNVRSRRPFDFDGFQIAGSLWGQYTRQADALKPNGNLLITDRWHTGIGDIGALVNFSYTRLEYLDSTRSNTNFVAQNPVGPGGSTVLFPDIQRTDYGSGDRERPSINGSLQWRPAPGLEFYADGLWQGFRNRISDRELEAPLWGAGSYANVVTAPNSNEVQSITAVDPYRPDGFQGGTYNTTNTYQFAVGTRYNSGPFEATADLARTTSQFTGSTESVDYAFRQATTVSANTGINGTPGPGFSLANFNPVDPNNYYFRGFYEENQVAKGDDWQGRVDLSYRPEGIFITRLQAGFRYTDRNAHRRFGNRYYGGDDILNQMIPFSAVPLDYEPFREGFRGDDVTTTAEWLAPTYDSIRGNLVKMRQFMVDHGATNYTLGLVPYDPAQSFDSNEKTYAAYAQASYGFQLGSIGVDGVVGIRGVKTDFSIVNIDGPASTHDTDWLPNASIRLKFTPQLQLRGSFTKTRTRPQFSQLVPTVVGSPPSCLSQPNPPASCFNTAGGGNPNLTSEKSTNYDVSLEYYFSRTGFASVALFRHNVKGYIENTTVYSDLDASGVPRLATTAPFNAGDGKIQGAEAQFNSFFDFAGLPAWAKSFGVQANLTYIDSNLGYPSPVGGANVQVPVIGISHWAYNIAGLYEKGGLSLRLSWNHRSSWTSDFEFRGTDPYTEITHPVGRLDLSASYDLTKNFTFTLDATNLLNTPYRSDLIYGFNGGASPATFPRAVRYEESVYSAGFRFRF